MDGFDFSVRTNRNRPTQIPESISYHCYHNQTHKTTLPKSIFSVLPLSVVSTFSLCIKRREINNKIIWNIISKREWYCNHISDDFCAASRMHLTLCLWSFSLTICVRGESSFAWISFLFCFLFPFFPICSVAHSYIYSSSESHRSLSQTCTIGKRKKMSKPWIWLLGFLLKH